jgi:hypothetical protein
MKEGTPIKAVRKGYCGNFYTAGTGNYLAVLEGDRVKIAAKADPAEMQDQKTKYENAKNNYANDIKDQKLETPERERIIKNSAETGVDPVLVVALKNVFKQGLGTEENADTMAAIELAYKYAQTGSSRYEAENPGKKLMDDQGNYTAEFLAYLCSHFNLFGDYEESLAYAMQSLLKEYASLKKLGDGYGRNLKTPPKTGTMYGRSTASGTFGKKYANTDSASGKSLDVTGTEMGKSLAENPEFFNEAKRISNRLGIRVEDLYKVMWKESGINIHAINKQSRATGLIQFMPTTAAGMGTSIEEIYNMTPVQQLKLVERFYAPYAGRLKDYVDLYLVTFYPYALGKGDDFVFGSQSKSSTAKEKVRDQNKVIAKFSTREDKLIDNKAFRAYVLSPTPAWIDTISQRMEQSAAGPSEQPKQQPQGKESGERTAELSPARKKIVKTALGYVDVPRPEFRTPEVNGGSLACAKVASTILCESGMLDNVILGVDGVRGALLKRGWKMTDNPAEKDIEAGDIVIWAPVGAGKTCPTNNGNTPSVSAGHKHIGIAVNGAEAVNNSSSQKMPVTSRIFNGRPVEAILKPPEKP